MTIPSPDEHRRSVSRLLIWDFDGTLVDTNAAILESARAALEVAGVDGDLSSADSTIGLPLDELFRHAVPGVEDPTVAALVSAYRADFDLHGVSRSRPFGGIGALIVDLVADDVPLALATSRRPRSLHPLMEAHGLRGHFDPVVTDEDVGQPKPHPEMLFEVCRRARVRPAETMMIGDTSFDMEMGARAGARTCAVTWGNHDRTRLEAFGVDHLVDSVDELRSLLAG